MSNQQSATNPHSRGPCVMGVIGLAVMGQNLALNIAEKGFATAVYNRTSSRVDDCVRRAIAEGGLPIQGFHCLEEFTQALQRPRKIILLVQAGAAVDQCLDQLIPLLTPGDLVIDGGNEWYENTVTRLQKLEGHGIRYAVVEFLEKGDVNGFKCKVSEPRCGGGLLDLASPRIVTGMLMLNAFRYMGMGVSGGEDGARKGPALMPGGDRESYALVEHVLESIAAKVEGTPCVSYIGPGGSGNYVKMVHNGIEYGDMQLITEAYSILKHLGGYSNDMLHQTFKRWNQTNLQSFLIEITADIFAQKDPLDDSAYLIDAILDVAGSKGTGMWTVQEAARWGVPCPTIQAALDMRNVSSYKSLRKTMANAFNKQNGVTPSPQTTTSSSQLEDDVRDALYCSKICSYAQGMMLLTKVSKEKNWNLRLAEIARGWRGGCIIRATFLNRISSAYTENPNLDFLLLDRRFGSEIQEHLPKWRRIVCRALEAGLPIPAFSSSLAYFDAFTTEQLPVNLVQAQRDYFGAHTYERVDRQDGPFHTQWNRGST